jgi:hypothetical protein
VPAVPEDPCAPLDPEDPEDPLVPEVPEEPYKPAPHTAASSFSIIVCKLSLVLTPEHIKLGPS